MVVVARIFVIRHIDIGMRTVNVRIIISNITVLEMVYQTLIVFTLI